MSSQKTRFFGNSKNIFSSKIEKIAVLLICLMLSIPVVAAQELSITKFSGGDNAKGYARVKDKLTIEADAKIPGEETIGKEQLRVYVEDSYAFFDKCEKIANTTLHKCTFEEPQFEAFEPITFKIELRNDDDQVVLSEDRTLIVDSQTPAITSINVDPPISSGKITVSYEAEDYGLNYGDTSQCAGIKTVTIKSGIETIATDTAPAGTCTKNNVFELTLTKTGTQQICATVKDYLNYESPPQCKQVTIDTSPPKIERLSILDAQGFEITHVHAGEERTASVNVMITDDGEVDADQVFGNFAQLNPSFSDFIQPDMIEDDLYTWQNIGVAEVSPCKLTIKARDTIGNEATKEFSCAIKADDTPPVVKGIIAQANRGGVPLYGYGTQLVVEFEEKDNTGAPGIGMSSKKAYLDLSRLGMGAYVQATNCWKESGAMWRCAWTLTPPSNIDEGTYEVTLSEGTSDDLENVIGAAQTYEIIYDNVGPKKPEVVEVKVLTGEEGIEYKGGAVKGNFVKYTVRSGDFETAFANFSDIGGQEQTTPTSCDPIDASTSDCVFESIVDLSGPYTAEVSFNFYDDAKNKASTRTPLEIYGLANETTVKYWKTPPAVTCSPRVIDRVSSGIIPPSVACRIDLQTPRKDITTLTVTGPALEQCTGDITGNVNDVYIVNNAEGSKNPYLFIKLEPKAFEIDELKINCPIQVFSRRAVTTANATKYFVAPTPQTVPVNITLQFYTPPVPDMYRNIDRKLEKAIKQNFANEEWLGQVREVLYWAEFACTMKNILTNLIGLLYSITLILGAAAEVSKEFPPVSEALEKSKTTVCEGEETWAGEYEGLLDVLDGLCSLANCQQVSEWAKGGKLFKGVYAPWCDKIQDALAAMYPEPFRRFAASAGVRPWNIKDSLILSALCLCIPGVIYNLDKWRQVECFKAVCYHDYVKGEGYPVSFCDDMHGYLQCALVIGEIFSWLPFAAFFDQLIQMTIDLITDPVLAFIVAIGGVCDQTCKQQTVVPFVACASFKTIAVILQAITTYKQYFETRDQFDPIGTYYCNRMEEIQDEMGL